MALINRAEVRRFVLEAVPELRPGWECKRVSKSALDVIEARTRAMIERMVASHPGIGQTFLGE